ncbi:DNA primase large subunit isoform X2 [Parasteatoda tepidariorum]|uniref:DNA primase large subunit isoform X2 n=1 Tax=Parasteatoda tepidariorum TaxID=114398 RepID=UPI00077F9674|nr:DNA primase large subunit isoform X2 [Parasteatoda tepidariorum]
MAVYIKPPKGHINLVKLCAFIKTRLLFLYFIRGKSAVEIKQGIEQENVLNAFDCLIEGSMKDRISHFVLRFLCSADFEMKEFFIQSETELFKYRLEFYSKDDLKRVMFNTCRQCEEVIQHTGIIKSYRKVLKTFIHLAKDFEIAIQNKDNFLKVPFIYVLKFVKRRLHPLTSGFVSVPLTELKHLLISFFEEFVSQGIFQTKSSPCIHQINDPRFSYMAWFKSNISFSISTSGIGNARIIREENLNAESSKFPQCMKNIHFLLRKTHRLQHHARIQYILFLKEIGVPYEEVLNLFMKEYSFPMNFTSTCIHSWSDSRNRYIYSIQHLFGRRGSRKNYRAHSCYSLQCCNSRSVFEGGCPFACFDSDNISKSLLSENLQVNDIEDIKLLSDSKKYTEACGYFLNKKLHILKQSMVSQRKDSSSRFENTEIKINNNQNLSNEILMQKKKNDSTFDNLSSHISKPSEFYFILSNFMN